MPDNLNSLPELQFENGDETLSPREFTIRERIQECFEVTVVAVSEDQDLNFKKFVNKAAGIGAATRFGAMGWTGVCNFMEMVRVDATTKGLSTYRLRIVPALWLLTQRKGHRIFQHKSAQEIVTQILDEYSIEAKWELKEEHSTYEYRVQYGETDFNFVRRLLEEDGISFCFAQEVGSVTKKGRFGLGKGTTKMTVESVLVMTDQPQAKKSIGGVYFHDHPNEAQRNKPFVTNVRLAHHVKPGRVTLRDYDFRRPNHLLETTKDDPQKREETYEIYRYLHGGSLIDDPEAKDKLKVADDKSTARHSDKHLELRNQRALEAARHGKRTVEFETNEGQLIPGATFTIMDHPRTDVQKKLLVIESMVHATMADWSLAAVAVFADKPYRPELVTEKPKVRGIQTAIVVGPKGKEIYVDEWGRVRVRFHWDREGEFDDNSTCWLRVSQGWAGQRFGMMLVPRIGQEVVVDYFDGDPDQPTVVGRVFNNTTKVPRKLPDHKTQAIWRSATSPHTDGRFNEIMFEDEKSKELLFWQAERDQMKLVKNDQAERTGRHHISIVGDARVAAIAKHDYTQVGSQRLIKVIKAGNLRIPEMGEPSVTERDTYIEVKSDQLTLTTGQATILLKGADIAVHAKGGIRFTSNAGMILDGSMIHLNSRPATIRDPSVEKPVKDWVAKPDRMLGSIEKLFWKDPKDEELERENIKVELERSGHDKISTGPTDMSQPLDKHKDHKGTYLKGELFKDGATASDVKQGKIGDCYLMAAMASVAHARPDIVEGMMSEDGDGNVTVNFADGPETVDTEVPYERAGWFKKEPIYGKSKTKKETWPAMMEKAYAEKYGDGKGYEGIGHGGLPSTAMNNIAGGTSSTEYLNKADLSDPAKKKALMDQLAKAEDQPMVAVTPKEVKSGRVAGNHAYTVMGTEKGPDGQDMVKLRNPWGSSGGTRGEFSMPVEDFAEDYSYFQTNTPATPKP